MENKQENEILINLLIISAGFLIMLFCVIYVIIETLHYRL